MRLIDKIKSVPMKLKIAGIVLFPIAGYLGSASNIISSSLSTLQETTSTGEIVKIISHVSKLTMALQVERGKSTVFLNSSSDGALESYYEEQRPHVDTKIKDLIQLIKTIENLPLMKTMNGINKKITELRQMVDNKSSANEVASRYTNIIGNLINIQISTIEESNSRQISKIGSLISLEKARESAGLLRANISSILMNDKPIDTEKIKSLEMVPFWQTVCMK